MTSALVRATVVAMLHHIDVAAALRLPGITHGDRTVLTAMLAARATTRHGHTIGRRDLQHLTGLARTQLDRSFQRLIDIGVLHKTKVDYFLNDEGKKEVLMNVYTVDIDELKRKTSDFIGPDAIELLK